MSDGVREGARLDVSRTYEAEREAVFRAWTDAEELRRWYAPVDGWVVHESEVDLRVGGGYRLVFGPPGGEPVVEVGSYREVVVPERLVFAVHLERGRRTMEDTVCTVEFADLGGRTEVRVVEDGYGTESARDDHRAGWTRMLDALADVLA